MDTTALIPETADSVLRAENSHSDEQRMPPALLSCRYGACIESGDTGNKRATKGLEKISMQHWLPGGCIQAQGGLRGPGGEYKLGQT